LASTLVALLSLLAAQLVTAGFARALALLITVEVGAALALLAALVRALLLLVFGALLLRRLTCLALAILLLLVLAAVHVARALLARIVRLAVLLLHGHSFGCIDGSPTPLLRQARCPEMTATAVLAWFKKQTHEPDHQADRAWWSGSSNGSEDQRLKRPISTPSSSAPAR
jgi:hypothetical protein